MNKHHIELLEEIDDQLSQILEILKNMQEHLADTGQREHQGKVERRIGNLESEH